MPHWTTPEQTYKRVDEALRDEEYYALANELRDTLHEAQAEGRPANAGSTAKRGAPVWSEQPPTEPGWYWRRPPAGVGGQPHVTEVRYGHPGTENANHLGFWTPFGAGRVTDLPAEWAGPIPMPVEP